MKKYDYILWDLDGTISDSAPGIVNSVVYALEHMGTEIGDRGSLTKFVGPPLSESFSRYYGYTPAQTDEAVRFFREYYREKGIYENAIYPGLEALLERLKAAGRVCVVATSKPEVHAKTILSRYGIDQHFRYIAGSPLDDAGTTKDQVISYALRAAGITDKARTVMVGDRSHDCVGARTNGLDCIGVLYGYGDHEELKAAGALALARDVDELAQLLL
ncbi:MAG: HAD hydrolase-like protein [Bacillota bacterium]